MTNNRAQHVRNMRDKCKSLNPVTTGDDSHWYIQLVDRNMKELYKILVFLPPDFPNVAPQITVSHVLEHPWVDPKTKIVMNSSLVRWSNRNDVGSMIIDILTEFTSKKPAIAGDNSRRISTVQEASTGNILETVAIPAIPTDFPELLALKEEELELLDSDASVLDGFIANLPLVTKYRILAQDQQSCNQVTADKCIQKYEELIAVQRQVQLDKTTLSDAVERVKHRLTERDALMMKYTPKTLTNELRKLMESSEVETNALLSDNFVLNEEAKVTIIQQRISYHKAKSLSDLISGHTGSRLGMSPSSRR